MYKIYTAGKMTGLSYALQMNWRRELERKICHNTDKKCTFVHPPLYWNTKTEDPKIDKEAMIWDLAQLRSSDIMVVNIKDINSSVGTHFELATALATNNNSNHHIYIVGFGESDERLHPWIENAIEFRTDNITEASDLIAHYLLI